MSELRPALRTEIQERFRGVDSATITNLWMADYCYIKDGTFIVNNVVDMFAFILRRTHPAQED